MARRELPCKKNEVSRKLIQGELDKKSKGKSMACEQRSLRMPPMLARSFRSSVLNKCEINMALQCKGCGGYLPCRENGYPVTWERTLAMTAENIGVLQAIARARKWDVAWVRAFCPACKIFLEIPKIPEYNRRRSRRVAPEIA